jgi:hypothetical protein
MPAPIRRTHRSLAAIACLLVLVAGTGCGGSEEENDSDCLPDYFIYIPVLAPFTCAARSALSASGDAPAASTFRGEGAPVVDLLEPHPPTAGASTVSFAVRGAHEVTLAAAGQVLLHLVGDVRIENGAELSVDAGELPAGALYELTALGRSGEETSAVVGVHPTRAP